MHLAIVSKNSCRNLESAFLEDFFRGLIVVDGDCLKSVRKSVNTQERNWSISRGGEEVRQKWLTLCKTGRMRVTWSRSRERRGSWERTLLRVLQREVKKRRRSGLARE